MKQNKSFLKLLILAVTVTIAGTAMAQVDLGIKAGLNLSSLNIQDQNGNKITGAQFTPGANVGLTFDIPVGYEFFIQPAALFSMKGAKLTYNANDYMWQDGSTSQAGDYTRINTYNIEVPVNFIYKPQAGNGHFMIGVGPYFAYAAGGNYHSVLNGNTTTGKMEFINDYANDSKAANTLVFGKPFDVGGNILVGYEFPNRVSLQLNGQTSFSNLEPKDQGNRNGAVLRNGGLGLSVGYRF
ncbi:MAG: PorT family protein [Niabella sp.]|nr:PorT family protein [Niabella sp.]